MLVLALSIGSGFDEPWPMIRTSSEVQFLLSIYWYYFHLFLKFWYWCKNPKIWIRNFFDLADINVGLLENFLNLLLRLLT